MKEQKGIARRYSAPINSAQKDFDPEEDLRFDDSDNSGSESSGDGLAGTEHYSEVGRSKLRKPVEVPLGPAYTGSRISREALLADQVDDENSLWVDSSSAENEEVVKTGNETRVQSLKGRDNRSMSQDEGIYNDSSLEGRNRRPSVATSDEDEESFNTEDDEGVEDRNGVMFEPPEDTSVDVDEDEDEIDSDNAFGRSDTEKYKGFAFAGSKKRSGVIYESTGVRRRPVAADFLSDGRDDVHELGDLNGQLNEDDMEFNDQHSDGDQREFSDSQSGEADADFEGIAEQSYDSDQESEMLPSPENEIEDDERARRDELRTIMKEEQKTVVATMSQAAKDDVKKGNAVKHQRKAFDSLLNVRMQLQKALVASNSMSIIQDNTGADDNGEPYEAAEAAALRLWNTLDVLRNSLYQPTAPSDITSRKRKHSTISTTTPSMEIWEAMQSHENHRLAHRHTILEKWSSKVKASRALPLGRGLNSSSAQQQQLTTVLQDYLSDTTKLVERTQVPRSCAPIQAKRKSREGVVKGIYDDADWYQLLLQELIASKRSSYNNPIPNARAGPIAQISDLLPAEGQKPMHTLLKEARTRKSVDTKASKGRKLRYGVHDKLVSFMAREDRSSWEEEAIERFFGSLLGQKSVLEEGHDGEEENFDEAADEEGGPFRLFGSR